MTRDIKDLLGGAFGDEPPLGIDREEVFEAGRKRLRRRRLLQSTSVVAAVVVVAAGAATFIAVNPSPELPPAATRTTEPSHTTTSVTQTSEPPTTTTHRPAKAADLTTALYSVLPQDAVKPGEDSAKPEFHEKGDQFYFAADVKRSTGDGGLTVTVRFDHVSDKAQCTDLPVASDSCSTMRIDGITVAYGDFQHSTGERGVATVAVLPGRVLVDAVATNYPSWERQEGEKPGGNPVFGAKDLARMLVRAGFRAG